MLVPEPHTLGDKGVEAATFRDPGQGEFDRPFALGEREARNGETAGNACSGECSCGENSAARQSALNAHRWVPAIILSRTGVSTQE
jgi:hypothetical protein